MFLVNSLNFRTLNLIKKKKDELSQGAKGVLSNLGIQQFCRKDFFITQSPQTKFQRQQNVVPSKLESS